jgi:hypothetical protein
MSNENQDFDGKLQVFWQNMQNQMVQVLNPFLSFMHFIPNANMLCMMLDLGLGLVI